jgi:hypothetical protein
MEISSRLAGSYISEACTFDKSRFVEGGHMTLRVVTISICLLLAGQSGTSAQQTIEMEQYTVERFRSTLDRYCVTCHNETLKTANLMLDRANVHDLGKAPQIWEKVISKLSLRSMPPVGMPRPDESFYVSFSSYLKSRLNSLAEANPDPGRTVAAHRLNRAEYTNAVRDLVGVEIDGAAMLPADNSGGFDNLGELLSVSQVLMEKYMSVARKVSRLAVGDTTIQADSVEYTIEPGLLQHERMSEDLPFGSRGGTAIRHHFPLDGEYVLNMRLHRSNTEALIIGLAEPHRLDVRVDGERVKLFTIGGENMGPAQDGQKELGDKTDPRQLLYEHTADDKLKVRFPMRAGIHTVQVTFMEEDFAWEGHVPPVEFDYFVPTLLGATSNRPWLKPSISTITIAGPYNAKGAGKTASREKIFVCTPANQAQEGPCARKILTRLARLAFRLPVNDVDIDPLFNLYRQGQQEAGLFEMGIARALEGLLGSPSFLFRFERDPVDARPDSVYLINDLELASRLSFFLWSSIPDDELLTLAEQGKLSQPTVQEQQVRRMLKDKRSASLVDNFAEQWLLLRNLPLTTKNEKVFPEFDKELRTALHMEVKLFVGSIFTGDRPILDLLRADYSFLNERLARHYGIEDVFGTHFRKVTLADSNQHGLLSRGGILAITSYANRNSTVLRGKWVLDNILASPPPIPPDDVPPLEATVAPPGETLTLRERMEIHPANPTCAVCHNIMDPIGFGLQNYDPIGQWRTEDEGEPIDASGRLPSGVEFEGPAELQTALLKDPELFANAFTQKLLTYAVGRPVEYFDMPTVRDIVHKAAEKDYRFSSIVLAIINSTTFQMRRAGP